MSERLGAPPPGREPLHPQLTEITPPFDPDVDPNPSDNSEENMEMAARSSAAQRMRSRVGARRARRAAEKAEAEAAAPVAADPSVDPSLDQGLARFGPSSLARATRGDVPPDVAGIAKDVGRGVLETPRALLTGAIGAVNEFPKALADITEALPKLSGGIQFGTDPKTGEFRFGTASKKDLENLPSGFRAIPGVPSPDSPESATGKGIEAISKFATGFVGAGKLKPLKALGGLGKASGVTSVAARGAVADFTAFDPHEARLADILEGPLKGTPVVGAISEFMASDPNDTGLEGRLKNAMEGLGLGVAFDGLVSGLRVLKAARSGKQGAETSVSALDEITTTVEIQRKQVQDLNGQVATDAPIVSVRRARLPAAEGGGTAEQGSVFVNWARIESPEDVKAMIQKLADENAASIDTARRGRRRGFAQTKLDAEGVNAWDTLQQRRVGEPLNAEQSLAVRELWASSGKRVVALAEQVKADSGSEITQLAFRKQLAVHNAIQEQVVAARTETARALAAWRIPAGDTLDFAGGMDQMASQLRGESVRTLAIAEGVSNMARGGKMLAETDTFVYGTPLQKTAGAIRQFWYASLLSGPHTHARNGISQTAVMGTQLMERKVASLLGEAFGQQNIPPGETLAMAHGMVMGTKDAFRVGAKGRSGFREAWETGQSGIGIGKVDVEQVGAFNPERFGMTRETPMGKALSYIDAGTRAPMRALAASDEVFKSAGARMETHALAYRQAWDEVQAGQLAPDGMEDRIARIIQDPDEMIRLEARSSAEMVTFTQEPSRDASVFKAMRAIQKIPVIGRMVMPFTRTAYNLANHAFQRTPIALVTKEFRADLAAGGARSDLAYSRLLTGSSMMMVFADMALKGQITGEGPNNFAERQTLMRTNNWQPMSFNLGGEWFSYRGLEPIATQVGLVANMVEILQTDDFEDENKEMTDVMLAASMSIANQVTSQQYMSGVSSFLEMSNDPNRYGKTWWNRIAASAIPTGISQINRATLDPIGREAVSALDGIRARTPGLSDSLPPKRDLWGKEISYASQWGPAYDLLVPIYGTNGEDAEPIDTELLRLGAPIGRPSKLVTFEGVDVNLRAFPEAYSRYVELSGNALTHTSDGIPIDISGLGLMDTLNGLVDGGHPLSPIYLNEIQTDGRDGTRARMIRDRVTAFRDAAKDQIMLEFPEVSERVVQSRESSGTQIPGVR